MNQAETVSKKNYVLLGNSIAPTLRDYFTARVADDKDMALLPASIGNFISGEAFSEIQSQEKDLNGSPVVVIQSLASAGDNSANDASMQLLFTVRTLKRNGAGNISVIAPFTAYSRQDRAFDGKMTSLGAQDFATMLRESGASSFSTIDMHSDAGINFFKDQLGKDNVYNLDPTALFVADIATRIQSNNICVGGPDAGANQRAENVSQKLNSPMFSFKKEHKGANETEVTEFVGDVTNTVTITIDDMIDTGGTIQNSQTTLAYNGASKRYVYAAAPLFNNNALERLFLTNTANDQNKAITQLVVTDSVDIQGPIADLKQKYGEKLTNQFISQITVGDLLYSHIQRDILNIENTASTPFMKAGI